jgi:hypothetical protein
MGLLRAGYGIFLAGNARFIHLDDAAREAVVMGG